MLIFVTSQVQLSGISRHEIPFKFTAISSLRQSKWEFPIRYQQFEKFGTAISLLLRETI